MKRILLANGLFALVDDDDYRRVDRHNWYAFRSHRVTYAVTRIASRTVRMHRFVLGESAGPIIDHVNGDGLDNRRCNLRRATHSQNQANMRSLAKAKTSRYKGVSRKGHNWFAQIQVDKTKINLGYFATEVEAATAYNLAARKHFGDFAALNDVPPGLIPVRVHKIPPHGTRNPGVKLTPEQVLEIRGSTEPTNELHDNYPVNRSTINRIRAGKTWKTL